ncbi:MAG: DUF1059 domain-containing protein [Ginsengibacter sp.]
MKTLHCRDAGFDCEGIRGNSENEVLNTVRKHCQHIYDKLYVSCDTEAVVKALKWKIVDL